MPSTSTPIKLIKDQPAPQGPDIVEIQQNLVLRGILDMSDPVVEEEVHGQVYGTETEHAVRVFQAQRGLTVDGVVGSGTWASLRRKEAQKDSSLLPKYEGMSPFAAEVAHILYGWYKQAEKGSSFIEKPRGSNFGRGIMQIQQWFDPAQNKICPPVDRLRKHHGFDTSSSKQKDLNRLKSLYRLLNVELKGDHPTDAEVLAAVRSVSHPSWENAGKEDGPLLYPGTITYFGLAWCGLTIAAACELACLRHGVPNPIGYKVWGSGSTVHGWYGNAQRWEGGSLISDEVKSGQVGCIGQPPDLHHLVFIVDVVGTNGSGRYITLEGNCENRVNMMIRNQNDLACTIDLPDWRTDV